MTWLLRFLQITAAALAFLFRKKKKFRLIAFSSQVFGYVVVRERRGPKAGICTFYCCCFFDENKYKIAVQTLKK